MIDKCIPRKGYKIYSYDNQIGEVTSGTYSIGLKYGIGLGFVNINYKKNELFINLRNKNFKGEIIKPPFIKKYSLHK